MRVGAGGRRRRLLAGCALAGVIAAPMTANAQLVEGSAALFNAGGRAPTIVQTARVTDVVLDAPRTILNWSSYNLSADQTVVYRFQDASWIVLNRVSGAASIDGQVEALVGASRNAGNVWFQAPGGVIFGANARVNVGGLLATTGAITQAGFLDTTNLRFTASGAAAPVRVRGGAEIKGGGGAVALIASNVSTDPGAVISGGSSLAYGAANEFTVRFGAQPGGLDLLDFVVPVGGGTASATPLSLLAQSAGGSVLLAVVSRADVASAVINAPGLIAAVSATTDRGDIILAAGVDVLNRQPGTVRTNAVTETAASFGVVTAQRDILGGFGSPTALTAAALSSGRDLGVSAASLDLGAVNAGRTLVLDAGRGITLRGGASSGGAATLRTAGGLNVSGGAINAIGRLQLDVGTVSAGRLSSGRSVIINASGAGSGAAAAIDVGTVTASDDVLFTASNAAGGIVLGAVSLTGSGADEAPSGRTLSLIARGAQGDVAYGGATGSALSGATNVILSAGRDVTANVNGLLRLNSGVAGRNLTIRAGDLDLLGPVTAANLRVESRIGSMVLGGAPASGAARAALAADLEPALRISDAEFQRISVTGEASFYAGSTIDMSRGDMTVLDLRVNPVRIPRLLLAAGRASDILVTGTLAPDIPGGTLTVGESDAASPWRPARILVTGTLGFALGSPLAGFSDVRPFDEVSLNAVRDVILGSSRFVALVATAAPGDINISANRPAGVAPTADERDRVFLTAGRLGLSASERIVQQNTGTVAVPNGILITSATATSGLAVTPARVVDLFGIFRDASGAFRPGFSPVVRSGGATSPIIRFNGCDVADTGCGLQGANPRRLIKVEDLDVLNPGSSDGLFTLPPEPPVLTFAQPEPDAIVTDPVMLGSGSDEVWRQKRKSR